MFPQRRWQSCWTKVSPAEYISKQKKEKQDVDKNRMEAMAFRRFFYVQGPARKLAADANAKIHNDFCAGNEKMWKGGLIFRRFWPINSIKVPI